MEVDVEGGGERGREDEEEEEGGYGDADEGQLGLARRVEEIGILHGEKRDADVGEEAEEREPGGTSDRGELVDAGDLPFVNFTHGAGPGWSE
jgi:hypothetical protein